MKRTMDFLKKNQFPLAAYCFAGAAVFQVFNAGTVLSTLDLLAYIFLAAVLFMKRRDLVTVIAAAIPSVLNLISMLIYSTSFWGFLSFFVGLLMPAYVACFLLPQLAPYVEKYRAQLQRFWFVPAAAWAAVYLINMVRNFYLFAVEWEYLEGFFYSYRLSSLLRSILICVGNLLLCNWMVFPDGLPGNWFSAVKGTSSDSSGSSDTTGLRFDMVAHVLLLLLTGGIWLCIWIYRTTKALNGIPGEEDRNPVTKLLLCMFVPFYYLYWVYKSAQRIDRLASQQGVPSDIATLSLVLAIFVNIVPPILMQDKMNAIATAMGQGAAPTSYTPAEPVALPTRKPELLESPEVPDIPAPLPHNSDLNEKDDLKKFL